MEVKELNKEDQEAIRELSKEEQLKNIFKNMLEDWNCWVDDNGRIIEKELNECVNILLCEVKIRTKL